MYVHDTILEDRTNTSPTPVRVGDKKRVIEPEPYALV